MPVRHGRERPVSTTVMDSLQLRSDQLCAQFADTDLPPSTADVEPLEAVAGQQRVQEAIAFGLRVQADGYNIAVSGPPGAGKNMAVRQLVNEAAAGNAPVSDWCYLYSFRDPYRPRAVALPSGLGDDLQRDLAELVEACRTEVPRAFESESYQERRSQTLQPVGTERGEILEAMQRTADQFGYLVNVTQMGFVAMPKDRDGQPLTPEVIQSLPPEMQASIEQGGKTVQETVGATVRQLRKLDQRAQQALAALDKDVTRFVVGPILDDLREKYAPHGLAEHFDAVETDIIANVDGLRRRPEAQADGVPPQPLAQITEQREQLLKRYTVNLFFTHGDEPATAAPVVVEGQPTYHNLFGRLDFEPRAGALTTDSTLIRPGAVHHANGGYLVLQVQDVLTDPRTWLKLKRSLKCKEARVEDVGAGSTPIPTVNVIPEAIPLDLKVVLVGSPMAFAFLDAMDPDFPALFKIRAEFEPDTPVDAESLAAYTGFVCHAVRHRGLRHLTRDALKEVLRFGARLAGRQDRLSTRLGAIEDLCGEADQLAADEGHDTVTAAHVRAAVAGKRRRSGLVADRLRRMIAEGTLHVETSGAVVGQVNGLAVYQLSSHAFGTPTRITCRIGLGRRGVVAIDREVERSGAIHSKGVLVLSGYLMGVFGRERPLAFTASITFEQSYDEVEGDSASSAELYAILTSLAGVPIRQDIAVTGSVDQFGNIQPVGGVTEKVEGFYDVCCEVGLTGSQGVMMPASNVVNLTLRDDVVQAVDDGRFHIWQVSGIEEGLELLTGRPAGSLRDDGTYPEDTIFRDVADALDEMQRLAAAGNDGAHGPPVLS